ncbi:hypothetical protein [Pseudomonas sp. B15(2017)]|uniref:hypothetical protein n=1 Tax=Pseudomonas sp. B15(2017) TaxID=1981744 RepID=UPI000A1E59E0|nr:hypothetical protein [Pseudomonas sp. B15(2017)]
MQRTQERVVVIGKRFGEMLEFTRLLNRLGIFNITLRSTAKEVVELLEAGDRFETLIFDNFEVRRDSDCLKSLAWYRAINLIILTSDVNFQERRHLAEWAKKRSLPSLRILQLPVRGEDLQRIINPTPAGNLRATAL